MMAHQGPAAMNQRKKVGRFLSYVLRHRPDGIGLQLDENGWADVDELIGRAKGACPEISREMLDEVVRVDEKQRFALSEDRKRIRANQGHSIPIDLGLDPTEPPEFLYHGTATRHLAGIRKDGLRCMERQYVHLSLDVKTATEVGQRHGEPIILKVKARELWNEGQRFYLSPNGVWLTDDIPAEFVEVPDGGSESSAG
jgi:putative RNA 2'-phosphotransferase